MSLLARGMMALALATLLFAGTAVAQDTGKDAKAPAKVILTVSGNIDAKGKTAVEFDRTALEALGMVEIETSTPWYKGPVKFEGVPLDAVMKAVGAKGERVVVVALNDYSSEIPVEDFAKYKTILALKRDGEYMPVRDKGPLFIVYPYDENPDLKSQKFYSRSVWQVAKLVVK